MMRLVSLFLLLTATATAFTTPQPWGTTTTSTVLRRFMFSTDDEKGTKAAPTPETSTIPQPNSAPALATMDEPVAALQPDTPKSVVRNMNTGELREVKWVDPAMSANTNPFQMSWCVRCSARIKALRLFHPILLSNDDLLC
jgi:hypothetical protein